MEDRSDRSTAENKMYKISPLINCFQLDENNVVIGAGSTQKVVTSKQYVQYKKIMDFLLEEKEESELLRFVLDNGFEEEIINELLDAKLITQSKCIFTKEDTNDFKNRLYVETLYSDTDLIMDRFRKMSFIVVGCGGIGNYLGYSLLSMNPRTMVLIDGDRVEENNLNRQFYFGHDDIGEYKADVLSREFRKRNRDVKLSVYNQYSDEKMLIDVVRKEQKEGEVLIIISGDANNVISTVTKVAVKCKVPFLNVGYLNDYSCIGPFYIPGKSSCPFCQNVGADYFEDAEESEEFFRHYYDAPSAAVNNSIASAMAYIDILHFIGGDYTRINSLNKRVGISNGDFEKLEIAIEKNEKCKYCG